MIPVIISGGSGKRLWPISRKTFPKQFCTFFEDSLQALTLQRLLPLGSPWTITVDHLKIHTENILERFQVPKEQVVYEPYGRNTAPAIGLLCMEFQRREEEKKVVGIFPADHLITDTKTFLEACKLGEVCAEQGQVVTLGITPNYPATGYGYIELTPNVFKAHEDPRIELRATRTKGFREKPDLKTAQKFLKEGNFVWNAGMFIFRVDVMIQHFQTHLPEMWRALQETTSDHSNIKPIYDSIDPISIDYGIMEKIKDQVCIPCNMGWNDLGSWEEMAKLSPRNTDLVEKDSKNNYVFSNNKKVYATIGVEDLIIVDSEDALLISKKDQTQKVNSIVDLLEEKKNSVATAQPFEYRPWGYFEILKDRENFKTKIIRVNPGQQLSYQSHKKRAEVWVILSGSAEVIVDGHSTFLSKGQSIQIPQGAKHRMRNSGNEVVEFIEVQTGSYFGEDDIVRYEDDYNRI